MRRETNSYINQFLRRISSENYYIHNLCARCIGFVFCPAPSYLESSGVDQCRATFRIRNLGTGALALGEISFFGAGFSRKTAPDGIRRKNRFSDVRIGFPTGSDGFRRTFRRCFLKIWFLSADASDLLAWNCSRRPMARAENLNS